MSSKQSRWGRSPRRFTPNGRYGPAPNELARGFTLVELIFTMAVATILLAIAVPNFNNVMRNTAVSQTTNRLVGTFTLARSEAANRGRTVCVVPNNAGWKEGWDVKVDMNSNNLCTDAGDTVLRNYDSLGPGYILASAAAEIAFNSSGSLVGGADQTVTVCHTGGSAPHKTKIIVRSTGVLSSYRDTTATDTTCS